jgi:ligand-binding sensor domain-containing protein
MCSATRKALTSVCVWLVFMPAWRGALALDPSLEINQYAHVAWSVRDGFARGEINAITQTSDGYLWLGTEFGLLRFDGVRAVPWQPPPHQHLPSTVVFSLLTTQDGTLWIGTQKGLATWKEGRLTSVSELAGQSITDLLQDREGSVWAGTYAIPQGKLCAIRNSGTVCYGRDREFGDGVYVLYEDSRNNLWAGVRTGLWRWKPGPPKFFPLVEPEGIRALGEDDGGALLIGMSGGIKQLVNGRSEAYPLASGLRQFKAHVRLFRDHSGSLWIGTADRGIVHMHQGKTDIYTQADNLSGDYVNAIFEDREGNIWVGTRAGLDRFRDLAVATFSSSQRLSNNMVTTVLASKDGSVWMGSAVGGLNRWTKGQITTFGEREPGVSRTDARTKGSTHVGKLKAAAPNALFQDRGGRIWVSTQSGVGYLEDNRFIPIVGIPRGQIPSMADDTDGNLWIAHQDFGLFQLSGGRVVQQIQWTALGHKDPAMNLIGDSRGGFYGRREAKPAKSETEKRPS